MSICARLQITEITSVRTTMTCSVAHLRNHRLRLKCSANASIAATTQPPTAPVCSSSKPIAPRHHPKYTSGCNANRMVHTSCSQLRLRALICRLAVDLHSQLCFGAIRDPSFQVLPCMLPEEGEETIHASLSPPHTQVTRAPDSAGHQQCLYIQYGKSFSALASECGISTRTQRTT